MTNPKYLIWSNDFSNLREYFPLINICLSILKKINHLSDFYLLLKM